MYAFFVVTGRSIAHLYSDEKLLEKKIRTRDSLFAIMTSVVKQKDINSSIDFFID